MLTSDRNTEVKKQRRRVVAELWSVVFIKVLKYNAWAELK